eukprot:221607_1
MTSLKENAESIQTTKLPKIPLYNGPNPFTEGATTIQEYREKLKIIFFTITLIAPIRGLIMFILAVCTAIIAMIGSIGLKEEESICSYNSIRGRIIRKLFYFACRSFVFVSGFYYIPIKEINGSDLSNKSNILVSNHVTMWDGFILWSFFQQSILVKAAVHRIPILGYVIKYGAQTIAVDRKTESSRKKVINEMKKIVNNFDAPPLLIFPVGTTTNQKYFPKYKIGAFVLGQPVQPLILNYKWRYGNLQYGHDESALFSMYYGWCQFQNNVEIIALPVYKPNKEEIKNPELFANNVRIEMTKYVTDSVMTNHQVNDLLLYDYCRDHNISKKK